jgi:TRAP-type C4-dicarboxylate transport system substrate-binding protein
MIEPEPKNFTVLMTPYLFETQGDLRNFIKKSDLFRSMMEKVERAGNVKFVGPIGDRPPRALSTTNRKVETPKDLKGLKVRVSGRPIVEVWKAWGANPTHVAAAEIYTSLKSGLVEGQDNSILAIRDAKYYEVQKYYIYLDYIRTTLGAFFNADKWNSLPEDVKAAIEKSAEETETYIRKYVGGQVPLAEKECKEKGMIILRPNLRPFMEIADKAARENDGKFWEKGLYDKLKTEIRSLR